MNVLQKIEAEQMARKLPAFRAGDTVRVHVKIREGEKERVQVFEGVVIRQSRNQARSTFTVRKVSYGVGVERIFPNFSPQIEKVEVMTRGRVRRSRLYYLRQLRGKKARIRERSDFQSRTKGSEVREEAGGEEGTREG